MGKSDETLNMEALLMKFQIYISIILEHISTCYKQKIRVLRQFIFPRFYQWTPYHPSLYDPLLTAIEVPSLIPWEVYAWFSSSMCVRGFHVVVCGASLGVSVDRGFPVLLTIWSVICSAFLGMLPFGGYSEGVYRTSVNNIWMDLSCHCRSGWYFCYQGSYWWYILYSDGDYVHPVICDPGI